MKVITKAPEFAERTCDDLNSILSVPKEAQMASEEVNLGFSATALAGIGDKSHEVTVSITDAWDVAIEDAQQTVKGLLELIPSVAPHIEAFIFDD